MRFGFVGPSYSPSSLAAPGYSQAAESNRTVNLIPEIVQSGDGKNNVVLLNAPGLSTLLRFMHAAIAGGGAGYTVNDVLTVVGGTGTAATLKVTSVAAGVIDGISVLTGGGYGDGSLPTNPVSVTGGTGTGATFNLTFAAVIKADYYDTASARAFAVWKATGGSIRLSEFTIAGVQTDRGQLAAAGGTSVPASISSNGTQLLIINPETTETAHILTLATNALTDETADVAAAEPVWGVFLDSYFIALGRNGKIYLSALNDGTTWDALDVSTPESSPDKARMIVAAQGELVIFGDDSVEFWFNSGNADFPFEPTKYATLTLGILYKYSAMAADNSVFWVGRGREGRAMVWRAKGYEASRISNHALEATIQAYVLTAGSSPVAWVYQEDGHTFYVLSFPDDISLPTWFYDTTTEMWHERTFLFETLTKATGVLTTTGVFSDGELVTVGANTYTMKAALSVPAIVNEVLIGASAAISLDNFKSAINASAGAGSTYSTGTVAHPTVTATTNTDTTQVVEAISAGGTGDSIIITTTAARAYWEGLLPRLDGAYWGQSTLTGGYLEQAHRGRCSCFVGGEEGAASSVIVGDRANGRLYKMNRSILTDAGDAIRRTRRAKHLSEENRLNGYGRLELDVEQGIGAGAFELRVSNDGGKRWATPRSVTAGSATGGKRVPAVWNRLGSGRDRVFEVRSDAAIKHAWIDAYLDGAPGAH